MGEPLVIVTDHLTKMYGSHIGVRDVTFSVEQGEIVGFLGPNGSGKTTVLRMLMGLISITSGRAELLGDDLSRPNPKIRANIGYLPGTFGLYENMTAAEFFTFLSRMRQKDCRENWQALCERFSLDPSVHIHAMSKGTRQKVGVIQAFMHKPYVLVLDEPTAGLDPLVQHEFNDLLLETRNAGASVLLSSHIMSEVERLTSKVAILNAGELISFGDITHLPGRERRTVVLEFESPANPALVTGIDGFTLQRCTGRFIEGEMVGSQRALLEAALRSDVVRIHSPEPSLDELFRSLITTPRDNHPPQTLEST